MAHNMSTMMSYSGMINRPLSINPYQHVLCEGVEGHKGGEAADKLWDHAELDEVLRLHLGEVSGTINQSIKRSTNQ